MQKRLFALFCILSQLLLLTGNSYGGDRTEAIKAAYVFNFAKFTYWTDLPDNAPLHIQVIGRHPFGKALAPLASKSVINHPIQIVTLPTFNPELPLHILFISRGQTKRLPSILKLLKNRKVLTISDSENFIESGGMIGLIEKNNTIHFTINLDAAKQAGIELNSQMLRLADSVKNTPVSR